MPNDGCITEICNMLSITEYDILISFYGKYKLP